MRLPLWPQGTQIIDEDGEPVGTIKKKSDRDFIIKAVNINNKLELLKQGSMKFQCDKCHEWLTVTVQEIIGSDIKLEQVLKGAEKE